MGGRGGGGGGGGGGGHWELCSRAISGTFEQVHFCQKWQQMDLPILAIYGNYEYWQEMNLPNTAICVRGQI